MSAQHRRNISLNIAGEGLWGFSSSLIVPATVLALLLKQYGADEAMIGSITSIETGAAVLPQLLGMVLFRRSNRQRRLLLWHHLVMIPWLGAMGLLVWQADRLPPLVVRIGLLAGFAGFQLSMGVIVAVWFDWIAHLFPQRMRGSVMGVSFACSAGMGALGGLLAGWIIHTRTAPNSYALLYLLAFTGCNASLAVFWAVVDPQAKAPPSDKPPPSVAELFARFAVSLRDRNFRAFLVGRLLSTVGFCIVPLIAVHFTTGANGGLTDATVVTCGAASTAGAAVANLTLGKLGDRFGHRLGIMIGTVAQGLSLVFAILVGGVTGCVLTYAFAGVAMGAGFISHYNLLFETCPHDHRIAHITVGNLVMAAASVTAPILAGLATRWVPLTTVFAVCVAFSIIALLWFALFMAEPRTLSLTNGQSPAGN